MKEFNVNVTLEVKEIYTIPAENEDQAVEVAKEKFTETYGERKGNAIMRTTVAGLFPQNQD